jgi:hypothetical protein
MCRRLFAIFLTVAVIAAAAVAYLITRPPAIRPMPRVAPSQVASAQARLNAAIAPLAPRPSTANQNAASQQAGNETSGGRSGATEQNSGTATIYFAEDDVNILLAGDQHLKSQLAKQGVTDAQVAFNDPNDIEVTGDVLHDGVQKSITINGTLSANGKGSMTFVPTKVYVGALPIPEKSVDSLIQPVIGRVMQQAIPRLPVSVQTVQVKDHEIVVTGTPKPY